MEKKVYKYLEAAARSEQKESTDTIYEALLNEDVEAFAEAMSAMRKLKKFKDAKEARAALEVDFTKLRKDIQDIEDTIAEMIHDVAFLLMDPNEEDPDSADDEEAFDKAQDMFAPLIKGVTSLDFKRVKEKIIAAVGRHVDSKHEKESEAASEKAKAEAPAQAE